MVDEDPSSGEDPYGLGRCTECGRVYTVRWAEDDRLRPIGTSGSCRCGNAEFEPYSDT